MPGKFEIRTAKDGQTYFVLKAGNSQVILTSELYKERRNAEAGIESVRKNAATAARFETKTAKDGRSYFVLKAGNGEVIGQSETYSSAAGCRNGIRSVQNNAPTANVTEAKK